MVALEIVVDDAQGLAVAARARVDRIELCSALGLGALTPSAGLMELASGCGLPVVAMVRPRPGDFLYAPDELEVMRTDIRAARSAGLAGVAFGVTQADGRLDRSAMARLVEAAGGMEVTVHRAFDVTPEAEEALETVVSLGITRIMTAGHAADAGQGTAALGALVRAAAGRCEIMAGGGVTAEIAEALIATGVDALHASCGVMQPVTGPFGALRIAPERMVTDADSIRALQQAMRRAGARAAWS